MLRSFFLIYKTFGKNGTLPGRVSVSEEVGAYCAAEIPSTFTKCLLSTYLDSRHWLSTQDSAMTKMDTVPALKDLSQGDRL